MRYGFTAVDARGKRQRGEITALNPIDAEHQLAAQGIDLIALRALSPRRARFMRLGRRDRIHFCLQLEQLLRAGIPMLSALSDLRDTRGSAGWRAILGELGNAVEGGQTLSQALSAFPHTFDAVFVGLIRAGEHAGRLPEALANLSATLKWEDEMAAQTRKLLLYPAVVGGIALAVTAFLMIELVPQLRPFLANMRQTLPLATRLLFAVSDVFAELGGLLLATTLALGAAASVAIRRMPRLREATDRLKLRLPLSGPILHKALLARFADTFGLLYAARVPVLDALASTRAAVGNAALARGLAAAEESIRSGCNLAGAFAATGLFPPLALRMLHVGEHAGDLQGALRDLAYFYHRDVREAVERAQSLIEPALTLLLGSLLAWIMLAVMGPVHQLIGGLRP